MGLIGLLRTVITIAIVGGVLLIASLALIDATRATNKAYTEAGKRTRKFWLLVLGAGGLFALMGALGMVNLLLNIIAIAPALIYWYDVRPAIKPETVAASGASNRRARRVKVAAKPAVSIDTTPAGKASDPRFD